MNLRLSGMTARKFFSESPSPIVRISSLFFSFFLVWNTKFPSFFKVQILFCIFPEYPDQYSHFWLIGAAFPFEKLQRTLHFFHVRIKKHTKEGSATLINIRSDSTHSMYSNSWNPRIERKSKIAIARALCTTIWEKYSEDRYSEKKIQRND